MPHMDIASIGGEIYRCQNVLLFLKDFQIMDGTSICWCDLPWDSLIWGRGLQLSYSWVSCLHSFEVLRCTFPHNQPKLRLWAKMLPTCKQETSNCKQRSCIQISSVKHGKVSTIKCLLTQSKATGLVLKPKAAHAYTHARSMKAGRITAAQQKYLQQQHQRQTSQSIDIPFSPKPLVFL